MDLLPHVPVVAVAPLGHVLLRHGDIGRDGAVEEVQGESGEDRLDRRRDQVERPEDGFPEGDMRRRPPRQRGLRDEEPRDGQQEDGGNG